MLAAMPLSAADFPADLAVGGNLALTSDYIYRGVSESDGHGAIQGDLHAELGGTFIGAWASSRDRSLYPYAQADLELYLGQRFDFSSSWGGTLSGRAHYYIAGSQPTSDDYEELTASLSYLDRWSLSVTAIPNAVRYWYNIRLGRSPAWVAETSAQWLIGHDIFLTGGLGYYESTSLGSAPAAPESESPIAYLPPRARESAGYAYGNAGIAWEHGPWRLDFGYFLSQHGARQLLPYGSANQHFAASVVWHF
jgi:uncharacterized protein (TIGR02001 family)